MPAERHDFQFPVEGLVYLDSSFVIAVQNEQERHHAKCASFFDSFDERGILPVVSDFVYEETAFHYLRLELGDAAARLGIPWRQVLTQQAAAFDGAMVQVELLRSEIEGFALAAAVPETVRPRAFDLMRRFRLLPMDAYHIAVALEHEVTSFVSLDADFLQVDNIAVYTCIEP